MFILYSNNQFGSYRGKNKFSAKILCYNITNNKYLIMINIKITFEIMQ